LTPFVAENVENARPTQEGYRPYDKRFTGEDYLRAWKMAGGHDVVQVQDATKGYEAPTRRNMPEPFEEKKGTKS
jgi:large subunit ribosomal protein L41